MTNKVIDHVVRVPLVMVLGVVVFHATAESVAIHESDFAAIDAYVEREMREQRIPGLALGIVRGDRIVYCRGFGVAGPDGEPMTSHTSLSIGSLTKSFTAVAAMQLAEAGQLDLDAPVQRYLPWFLIADHEISSRMTIRHLLHHTSGLPRDFESPATGTAQRDASALEKRLRNLSAVQPEQALGTYGYSNVGYQVLALIIERVSGDTYESHVRQHIFSPLEMHDAFATLPEASARHPAVGYHYWFGIAVASGPPAYPAGPGNGGLFASAEDMSHYLLAHLNRGRYGSSAMVSAAGMTELHRPAVARPDGHYAMGWGVRSVDSVTWLSHSGQSYNFMAKIVLVPDSAWGVVVLQNSQYMVRLASGDHGQDMIADGVTHLLMGRQPQKASRSPGPTIVYGVLVLILVIQLAGIVRTWVRLRQGPQPEHRPRGALGLLRHVVVPMATNLGWATLTLVGLAGSDDVTTLTYQIPDVSYTLLASGVVALLWGIIRTAWSIGVIRMARSTRVTPP